MMPYSNPPPKSSIWAITAVLVTAVLVIGVLVYSGKDVSAVAGFLLAIIPGTFASLFAVKQNDHIIADNQTIKANVNGNLSRLIEIATANTTSTTDSTPGKHAAEETEATGG